MSSCLLDGTFITAQMTKLVPVIVLTIVQNDTHTSEIGDSREKRLRWHSCLEP